MDASSEKRHALLLTASELNTALAALRAWALIKPEARPQVVVECFEPLGFVDADALAEHLNTAAVVRVGIRVEGGIVQSVFADAPVDALIVDYDTDSSDDESIYAVPQGDGTTSRAWIYQDAAPAMPEELDRLYALIDAGGDAEDHGVTRCATE